MEADVADLYFSMCSKILYGMKKTFYHYIKNFIYSFYAPQCANFVKMFLLLVKFVILNDFFTTSIRSNRNYNKFISIVALPKLNGPSIRLRCHIRCSGGLVSPF